MNGGERHGHPGSCFRVANELGPGFLEKVYENALAHELRKAKVNVELDVKDVQ